MEFNSVSGKIQGCLDEFVDELGYGRQLKVSGLYPLYDEFEQGTSDLEQYPGADSPGVYIFCSPQDFLYIGKSSRYMGNRIWAHIGRAKRENEKEEYPNAEEWIKESKPNVGVFTVSFADDHWWLSSALEGYLTEQLKPEYGAKGRRS
ncbi:MAG: hypothetical protein U9N82_11430 [Thermodesulfobacteriota bacterium]|nr:hypothetical protein [Thermodesulfobacteriota bacterium]